MYHWLIVYHAGSWQIDFGSWEREEVERGYLEEWNKRYEHIAIVSTQDDTEHDIAMLCAIKPKPSNKAHLLAMH